MNITSVKNLVELHDIESLLEAEKALLADEPLPIDVGGDDEGEQLTHVMAAMWVIHHKHETGADTMTAIRAYTQKVRTSIS